MPFKICPILHVIKIHTLAALGAMASRKNVADQNCSVFLFLVWGWGKRGDKLMCRVLVFSTFFTISSFTVATFRAD